MGCTGGLGVLRENENAGEAWEISYVVPGRAVPTADQARTRADPLVGWPAALSTGHFSAPPSFIASDQPAVSPPLRVYPRPIRMYTAMPFCHDEEQALLAREQREFLLAQYYPYYAAEFGRCHALGCPMYLAVVDEAEGIWVSSGLAQRPGPASCVCEGSHPSARGPGLPRPGLRLLRTACPAAAASPALAHSCHRHPACLSSSRARRPPPPPLRSATTRSGSTWTR